MFSRASVLLCFAAAFLGSTACLAQSAQETDDPIARKIEQLPPIAIAPLTDAQIIEQSNAAGFSDTIFPTDQINPTIVKLQILLARKHVSPGVIDGLTGGNLSKAIVAYQRMYDLPTDGQISETLWSSVSTSASYPVLKSYQISPQDVAGPFEPNLPTDYAEMAELKKLAYREPSELLAEKFHMDETFLKRINPDVMFSKVGSKIIVADVGASQTIKVKHIVADKENRLVLGYDKEERLVVAYPATIGSPDLPSPTGRHAVKAIAENPEYSYRPDVNFKQGNNTKPLTLPPGPNGPVGSVWIGLDKPTYGIHGSPEPSKIDKANSHGCVRLTNWDAEELAKLVEPGVTVDFLDGSKTLVAD